MKELAVLVSSDVVPRFMAAVEVSVQEYQIVYSVFIPEGDITQVVSHFNSISSKV